LREKIQNTINKPAHRRKWQQQFDQRERNHRGENGNGVAEEDQRCDATLADVKNCAGSCHFPLLLEA
jgi:hypothetical protein